MAPNNPGNQKKPDAVVLDRLRQLVLANLSGRDELYEAAQAMDDHSLASLCRRLAEKHAARAIELQQRLLREGESPPEADAPDVGLPRGVLDGLHERGGDDAVVEEALAEEETLRRHYELALKEAGLPEIQQFLERHRENIDFAEHLLETIRKSRGANDDAL